jgi:hypothetical protein
MARVPQSLRDDVTELKHHLTTFRDLINSPRAAGSVGSPIPRHESATLSPIPAASPSSFCEKPPDRIYRTYELDFSSDSSDGVEIMRRLGQKRRRPPPVELFSSSESDDECEYSSQQEYSSSSSDGGSEYARTSSSSSVVKLGISERHTAGAQPQAKRSGRSRTPRWQIGGVVSVNVGPDGRSSKDVSGWHQTRH